MKLCSIFISFVILVQSIGLVVDDIVQLDDFIEHAQFHSQEYGDNILVFISKHYGELKSDHEKAHKEEKRDHEKLPFQHNIQLSSIVVLSLVSPQNMELKVLDFIELKSHNFFYKQLSSSQYTEGLFQPPRYS